MKVLITELANEICVSINELMVFQQTMNKEHYTGVGKRTWFTLEGVEAIRKHFTGPHVSGKMMRGVVLGQCPNKNFVFAKVDGKEGKVFVRIPKRLVGKVLDRRNILIEELTHEGADSKPTYVMAKN